MRLWLPLVLSMLAPLPAMASVTYNYTGFSITFNDGSLAPASEDFDLLDTINLPTANGPQVVSSENLGLGITGISGAPGSTHVSNVYSVAIHANAGYQIQAFTLSAFGSGGNTTPQASFNYALNDGAASGLWRFSSTGGAGNGGDISYSTSLQSPYTQCADFSLCTWGQSGITDLTFTGTVNWQSSGGPYSGLDNAFLGVQAAQFGPLPVPEPETWALLGIGLLGMGLNRRRLQGKATRNR